MGVSEGLYIMSGNEGERAAGGEGGIRTPDTVARMPHFECGAIDHSATSPGAAAVRQRYLGHFRPKGNPVLPPKAGSPDIPDLLKLLSQLTKRRCGG